MYKYSYEDLLDIGITNEWLFKDKKDIENELLRDEITNLKSRINELEKLNEERAKSLALENVETIEVKEVGVGTEDNQDEGDETELGDQHIETFEERDCSLCESDKLPGGLSSLEIKDIAVENENKNGSVADDDNDDDDDDDDEIILEGEDLL